MTVEEKAAVGHLLKSNFLAAVEEEAASAQPNAPGLPGLLADVYQAIATANDAATSKTKSDYVNLKFVLKLRGFGVWQSTFLFNRAKVCLQSSLNA